MNIAIFDHQLNNGGGTRFLYNLLSAIKKLNTGFQITLFCNRERVLKSFIDLEGPAMRIVQLESLKAPVLPVGLINRSISFIKRKLGKENAPPDTSLLLRQEIEMLASGFDLAYFPWPFLLHSPDLRCPKVATFHDFNFRYFFGTPIFSPHQLRLINESMPLWMASTFPIVSTNFMKTELEKFYPEAQKVEVIHLASLNVHAGGTDIQTDLKEYQFLEDKPFLLLPVHMTAHKNVGNVISALSIINKTSTRVRLALTGGGTDMISGRSSYIGLINDERANADVIGLGYVSDEQMLYLQKKAFAVVNASLYEAGNGVGLDAWPLGIPVIQSDIPAFNEHIELQGHRAFTFDPKNPASIAAAISECLNNNTLREQYIETSLKASQMIRWDVTARKYIEVFQQIANKHYAN